ncbi:MAG: phage holin family protein [Epulopiscium sp.]|nr:phage holin family protein [Candidatus Epulonipiscium sp.]
MRELIARLIINTAALYGAGQFISGIHVDSWGTALWGAIIFSVLNMIVKPILKFISFPITCLTIGLFSLVINGFILYLTAFLSSIQIDTFGAAFIGGIVVGIINWFLGMIFLADNK